MMFLEDFKEIDDEHCGAFFCYFLPFTVAWFFCWLGSLFFSIDLLVNFMDRDNHGPRKVTINV